MVAPAVVEIERLVKDYGPVHAVRGIDLVVRQGEVFGFLGPNGAGKTTTIRCLLGLLHPTSGSVSAFGLDAIADGVRLRSRVAYVPGELRLPERLSGAELVALIGRIRGRMAEARRDELAEMLAIDLHRPLRDLSTGNRRKIALLIAFMSDAELLVLDEPTNGLDPLRQRVFLDLVRQARDRGATVFLSSHVLSEVQRVADRVAVLRRGEVIAEGSVDDLRRTARQRVEVWFDAPVPDGLLHGVPGLADVAVEDHRLSATLAGPAQPLVDALAGSHVTSLVVEEPDLEDAFVDLYREPA